MKYESIQELVDEACKNNEKISTVVLRDQAKSMEVTELELFEKMEIDFEVMKSSVLDGVKKDLKSMSGLTGGEGFLMKEYADKGDPLCGSFLTGAMSRALSVAGCNAAMGKIVAAPTAGSCGIIPGCLISMCEDRGIPEKDVVMSLFTAGAFGMVIAARASIAGAEGGCQAECGSASAMAAAALVELMGGTPEQCADASALAIASELGLVCDPVGGLVEIPCIKRNATGVMLAFSCADMVLAGIRSKIPADECLDAMREVGDEMPRSCKETAKGGLAATPTARKLIKGVSIQNPSDSE
ncbi:MAG: L-serine ammonia-lyase, iron-sulfur-dependent, subunit alpha [Lachnospiraceae bacterium]|nr:L-serine ammonia-lyase, iron-sulfur-dependent, subunit alpha [Lachnospiraceae bacterium]